MTEKEGYQRWLRLPYIYRPISAPEAKGVVVGEALAVAASRIIASRLYGLNPLDPVVYLGLAL